MGKKMTKREKERRRRELSKHRKEFRRVASFFCNEEKAFEMIKASFLRGEIGIYFLREQITLRERKEKQGNYKSLSLEALEVFLGKGGSGYANLCHEGRKFPTPVHILDAGGFE